MNFSSEEIYSLYGQYDSFVTLEFNFNSEEFEKFGSRLMGVFLYTLEERRELEKVINQKEVPRTDVKIKFTPSDLERFTPENIEELDKYGIQASSLSAVSSLNLPRKNRFIEKGTKEIPNQIIIQLPPINGWQELNRMRLGQLNSIYQSEKPFTPYQEIEYWGLHSHFGIKMNKTDIKRFSNGQDSFIKKVRLLELECKYHELTITEEQINEFVDLTLAKILYKNAVIDKEIQMSGDNVKKVMATYKEKIDDLRKCCSSFEEDVIRYGDRPIYLTYERFVHIYARHVSETQIGERFSAGKTVFQYKFDDIRYLLKMVVDCVSDEIQEHFRSSTDQPFRRMGKRAVYVDGHYYRLVIEPTGSILDFHPFNIAEG
ncbi:MAG: hypothetical protein HYZ14_04010 [Bacteroidetes bacterium]|nr:hypothetical protein [Bacteroidota bacterium]